MLGMHLAMYGFYRRPHAKKLKIKRKGPFDVGNIDLEALKFQTAEFVQRLQL